MTGHIEIDPELCKDCRLCISVCPQQLIEPTERMNQKGYRPVQFTGKAAKKEITLGLQNTTMVEVSSGVAEGDLVIAEGNFGLEDGGLIEITGEVKQ